MTAEVKCDHYISSLSFVDLLVSLYFSELQINPQEPHSPDRDRFVLSKGHAAPSLYAVLVEGIFPAGRYLVMLREYESNFQGYPVYHRLLDKNYIRNAV